MSNFRCEICGTDIYDSSNGYVTGCKHYPFENDKLNKEYKKFYMSILDVISDLKNDENKLNKFNHKKDNFYKNADFIDSVIIN